MFNSREESLKILDKIFEDGWEKIYKDNFVDLIKEKIFNDTVMQVIVWNYKYRDFHPSFPIYNRNFLRDDEKIDDYVSYIRGNYDSFSFAKLMKENSIKKEIKLLLHSKEAKIESRKDSVTIYLKESMDIDILRDEVCRVFELERKNYPIPQEFLDYFRELDRLLNKFSFRTILIKPIFKKKHNVVGVISIYSKIENYRPNELDKIVSVILDRIIQLRERIKGSIDSDIREKKRDKKKEQKRQRKDEKRKIRIRNIISAIMSRNISHNIGSHVLVNVEHHMNNTPIEEHKKLINYILERMNFITQVSTLWSPIWSLPRFFGKEIIQQFLEQKHILHNIVTTDGLEFKDSQNSDYYIIPQRSKSDEGHYFKISRFNDSQDSNSNSDVLVDIPGGKIGYHAIYTIIENILRNSAKYGYATLSKRYRKERMELKINIEKIENNHEYKIEIWDNVSYISNLKYSFEVDEDITNEDLSKPIITKENDSFIKIEFKIKEKSIVIYVHRVRETKKDDIWLEPIPKEFEYQKRIEQEGVFFISQARFHSMLKNIGDKKSKEDILIRADILNQKDKLVEFIFLLKKRVFNPLHIAINNSLRQSLLNNEDNINQNNINKNNGISEIKICALYLSGEDDYNDLAKSYKDRDREYIKAIAKEERDGDDILCYRLGYEFKLQKPTVYSLYLSKDYKKQLSFLENCIDKNSFVLIDENGDIDSTMRKSKRVVSSEFLIYDSKTFDDVYKNNYKKLLNESPYRIVVLVDGKKNRDFLNKPFIKKRVALFDINDCKKMNFDKEIRSKEFQTKILECWIEHTLLVNRYSQIDAYIELDHRDNSLTIEHPKEIAEDLLIRCIDKLSQQRIIEQEKRDIVVQRVKGQSQSIIKGTKFESLFKRASKNQLNKRDNISRLIEYKLKGEIERVNHKNIILFRHKDNRQEAIDELKISTPCAYFEPLSGGTNQFWLYRQMFKNSNIDIENLFNRLKLLETALYNIAIFDERINKMINPQKAREQVVYIINSINDYKVSSLSEGLIGTLNNEELMLKNRDGKKVNIDILIVHYGLLEKMKDNSKLTKERLDRLLFSFPMVVLTSGRGIILMDDKDNRNRYKYIKFISFAVLKEYFKDNTINKIVLHRC